MNNGEKKTSSFKKINLNDKFVNENKEDFREIYKTTYDELVDQQAKRDTVVKTFITLIAFAIPLSFSDDAKLGWNSRMWIFLGLGIIGLLFSLIIIRYREYKEAYWLACRTAAILDNAKSDEINKELIQNTYLYCLEKNSSSFTKNKKASFWKIFRKSLFSAESLYLILMALVSGSLIGIWLGALLSELCKLNFYFSIIMGGVLGLIVLVGLYMLYCKGLYNIYKVMDYNGETIEDSRFDDCFNKTFKKAWTLHTYYDAISDKKTSK